MVIPTEEQEHLALIQWVILHPICRKYLIHIPNGGSRNIIEAAKLKKMGVKAGVSDLFLAYPNGIYYGLWIELKRRKGGILTKGQRDWLYIMQAVGYSTVVAYGWEEAKEMITEYLNE